jgi:hypothetical protein
LRREAGGGGFRTALRPCGAEDFRLFHMAKMGRIIRVNQFYTGNCKKWPHRMLCGRFYLWKTRRFI